MEMPSSISSLSSTASFPSLSPASSGLFHTGTPHLPSAPKMKAPTAVVFWYEDDAEDPVPAAAERFSCSFLEECRLCKRRLGAGRDAYMFGGEAAFCSEECRREWMELLETSSGEKIRRRTAVTVKACRSPRIPAGEMCSAAARYRAGGALVAG